VRDPIRLFFYRSDKGLLNFGDELSPEVVSYVTGRAVVRTGRMSCDLTGIGSILDRYLMPKGRLVTAVRAGVGRPVRVWGSGIIKDGGMARHSLVPLALRGALTREILGAPLTTPLGDPGLLAAAMIGRSGARRGIGIVPHYTNKTDPMVAELARLPGARILDVERGGAEVCGDIGQCAVILSSSLHGLIVADAFGIPNWRLGFERPLKGGDFKFNDYSSALGRADIAAHILKSPDEALDLARRDGDFAYQAKVDAVCTGLEQALKAAF
jgi:pyruvyltransferase